MRKFLHILLASVLGMFLVCSAGLPVLSIVYFIYLIIDNYIQSL